MLNMNMFTWEDYISKFGWEIETTEGDQILLFNRVKSEKRTWRVAQNNMSPADLGKLLDFTPSKETMELVKFNEKLNNIGFKHLCWIYDCDPYLVDDTREFEVIQDKKDCLNYWKSGNGDLSFVNKDIKSVFLAIQSEVSFARYYRLENNLTYEIRSPEISLAFKKDIRTLAWTCDFEGQEEHIDDIKSYIERNFHKFNTKIALPKYENMPLQEFVL